jgi:hypothetical protein
MPVIVDVAILNVQTGKEAASEAAKLQTSFEVSHGRSQECATDWTKISGPIAYELADSYGQFAELHLCQDAIIH